MTWKIDGSAAPSRNSLRSKLPGAGKTGKAYGCDQLHNIPLCRGLDTSQLQQVHCLLFVHHVCVYIYINLIISYTRLYKYVCIFISICLCVFVRTYVRTYGTYGTYACMHACMYVCNTYIYTHTHITSVSAQAWYSLQGQSAQRRGTPEERRDIFHHL